MNELTNQEYNLIATTFEEAMKIATIISKTDFCPKQFQGKPESVLLAIQYGKEVGLKPLQAIQNIGVINGKPSLYGDGLLAIIKNHPDYEYMKETCENGAATCEIKRKGEPLFVSTFTEQDAKKAGLWGKQGPWSQYSNRMLQMRARGFACRDAFPDALNGLISTEEAQDYEIDDTYPKNKALRQMRKSTIDNRIPNINTMEAIDNINGGFMDEDIITKDLPNSVPLDHLKETGIYSSENVKQEASSASLHELYTLIAANGIGNEITDKWIKVAKVRMLEELSQEHVLLSIEWIKKRYPTIEE